MLVKAIPNGKLATNTYLIICEDSLKAAIIDPADGIKVLLSAIDNIDIDFKIEMIINTHGHSDHIAGNKIISNRYNCDIAIGEKDAIMLQDTDELLAQYLGMDKEQPSATILLKDNDKIKIGEIELTVIETPGHTEGGISLYCESEGLLFSGDTLFRRSIGRVDLPGGDLPKILNSLQKLMKLPNDTFVYPGHSKTTRIGFEKENNPYCQKSGEN